MFKNAKYKNLGENLCRLLNKSLLSLGLPCYQFFSAYCRITIHYLITYIKYVEFGLVGFYGISTIVGYLMPNPLYTYILNIYNLVWLGFMAYQQL